MKIPRELGWWQLRAILFALVCATNSANAATFAPVVISGTEPIGVPGTLIGSIGIPRINNLGQVTYNITLKADSALGISSNNDAILYAGSAGAAEIVAREAGQVPGFPAGVNFVTRSNPSARGFSDDGRVIFPLALAENVGAGICSSDDSVTWFGAAGSVAPLMREGDPAPGFSGLTIDAVGSSTILLTETGKVYQRQIIVGPGVTPDNGGTVLYGGTTPANLTPLLRSGDPAPNAPSGALLSQIFTVAPKGDRLLVSGSMVQGSGGVLPADDFAIWTKDGNGPFQMALREGGLVSGAPVLVDPGTRLSTFDEVAINKFGTVLTWGSKLLIDGVHASSSNDTVVLVGTAATGFNVIAREGTPAPGLPGTNYGSSFSEARIAGNGEVLIYSTLNGPGVTGNNDGAFFKGQPANPQLLLREGDQAPGFAPGVQFQQWSTSDFLLDDNGMFALIDTVNDGTFSSEGIFVTNPATGVLELLIKQGDSLEVSPGTFKVISDLDVAFGPSGQSANNQHQLTFNATFTDGTTGAFIASVPEPSALALLSVCAACSPLFGVGLMTQRVEAKRLPNLFRIQTYQAARLAITKVCDNSARHRQKSFYSGSIHSSGVPMRATIVPSILILASCVSVFAEDAENQPPPVKHRAIAADGGIEVISLRTVRRVSADETKDTSGMEVGFWLTRKSEGDTESYAVQFLSLDPIQDDLGNELMPEKRRKAIPFLGHDIKTSHRKTILDKSGPTVSIVLDAPGRDARKIKSIKGQARISTLDFARLKFDDLAAVEGKPLEHVKLDKVMIVPTLRFEDGQTTVSLRVPLENGLIEDWGIGQKGQLLFARSKTSVRVDDSILLTKSYKGDRTKDSFLGILLAEPHETSDYEFEFKDVELP